MKLLLDKIEKSLNPSIWDKVVQVFKTGKIYLILGLDIVVKFTKSLAKPAVVIKNLIDIVTNTKNIY